MFMPRKILTSVHDPVAVGNVVHTEEDGIVLDRVAGHLTGHDRPKVKSLGFAAGREIKI